MVKEHDRKAAFDYFMENANRLLADRQLREVLMELDEEGEEAVSQLAPDPAAFLRHRGVQIPEDFRTLRSQDRRTGRYEGWRRGWWTDNLLLPADLLVAVVRSDMHL